MLRGAIIATVARTKTAQDAYLGEITNRATAVTDNGRQVTAAVDIPMGIRYGGRNATVTLGYRGADASGKIIPDHTIIIEPARAILDRKLWTPIPATVGTVDLAYTNRTFSIAADQKLQFAAKLDKKGGERIY